MKILNFYTRWIVVMVVFLFLGCASGTQKDFIRDASVLIKSGNWDDAYRSLEDGLGSTNSATRLAVFDLITSNFELRLAAARSFEPSALEKTFKNFDPISAKAIETARLNWYDKFASDKDFSIAQNNIESEFLKASQIKNLQQIEKAKIGDGLIVNEMIFNELEYSDQEKIKEIYPMMQIIPKNNIGKIISQQILDKSKPGSNFGSQLGSVVGQSAYIDQAFNQRSYSAVGQLSAGIIGALIGASLNKDPETKFLINYGVQLADGAVKSVLTTSTDGVASPIGQCVFISGIEEAPSYLCTDSIVNFLERVKNVKVINADFKNNNSENQIICQINTIGKIKITRDNCLRLKGVVVD